MIKSIAYADTYVMESYVHFPTDLNLLWDAKDITVKKIAYFFEYTGILKDI